MARIIGIITIVLLAGSSVFGQFTVQPAKVSLAVPPGRRVEKTVYIESTEVDRAATVDLRIAGVTQDPNGVWQVIEPNDPDAAKYEEFSCRTWLTLDRDSVEVDPLQRAPIKLSVTVPSGSRGYHCAAIVATMRYRAAEIDGFQATMLLQFVVPVIIEVHGRLLRHDVKLKDAGLTFQPRSDAHPAASIVNLEIENAGGTFSRVKGLVRLSNRLGGRWRRITQVPFPEEGDLGIIPHVTLNLKKDVGRPLPAGDYKVEGFLVVDGRPTDQIEREFRFAGDPRAISVAPDAGLDLSPVELSIASTPGGTRVGTITVGNASEDKVNVEVEVMLPEHMRGMTMRNPESGEIVLGEQFGCMDWLSVEPQQFELRNFGRQSVKVVARMPKDADRPDYYAVVKLHAKYPDGQEGGTVKAYVYVSNRRVEGSSQVDAVQLTLGELSPSQYLVAAQFANVGNTHILPRCRAMVVSFPDNMERKRLELSSERYDQTGNMLPFEYRMFSGVLNASSLTPGTYRLAAQLDDDKGGSKQHQIAFEVKEENGAKVLQQVGLAAGEGETVIRF